MPHYRCPACRVTTHSVAGYISPNTCPNCSAPLASFDRIYIGPGAPDAISLDLAATDDVLKLGRGAAAAMATPEAAVMSPAQPAFAGAGDRVH